ncbi:hypothetical protein, partial [Rhodoferax sp.]|uniref:hypothetical protein n=1 Tax=Rhodoferax sp. TaxID=50421 RepID=UPI003BB54BBB
VAEGAVRAFGLVGFPLYAANAQIGYIPAASQQGSFLNKNDWQFNALHMGAPAFKPDAARDVLLLGDSVVFGGNAYRQPERLGPALQAALQVRVGGGSLAYFGGQLGAAQCAGLHAPEPASARWREIDCVCVEHG